MKVSGTPRRITLGDREVLAIEQQFEIGREDWNEYKLLDGGRVRIKTTVARIFRVVDENGNQQYNDQGEPELVVRHKSDIVASIEQG